MIRNSGIFIPFEGDLRRHRICPPTPSTVRATFSTILHSPRTGLAASMNAISSGRCSAQLSGTFRRRDGWREVPRRRREPDRGINKRAALCNCSRERQWGRSWREAPIVRDYLVKRTGRHGAHAVSSGAALIERASLNYCVRSTRDARDMA